MKTKTLAFLSGALITSVFIAPSHAEWVNGYIRQNGTYVQGYNRTKANNMKYDNYSTKGNTNPYTGSVGKVNSYGFSYPAKPKPFVVPQVQPSWKR